jgi:hypothetical protein
MGQQLRLRLKRARRKSWIKRKKQLAKQNKPVVKLSSEKAAESNKAK